MLLTGLVVKGKKGVGAMTSHINDGGQHQAVFRKTINKTVYIVKINFSVNARETMEEKIKRMIRNEVRIF